MTEQKKNSVKMLAAGSAGASLALLGSGAGDFSDPTTPIGLVFAILTVVLRFFAAKDKKQ